MPLKNLTFFLVAALIAPESATANIGDFGFGSRTAALAGASTAFGFDSFAAYSNPAGLPEAAGKKLSLGYGWIFMDPSFKPIENITIENKFNSDQVKTGSVDENYRSVLGQTIGAAALLSERHHQLSAGITLFTPFDPLGFTDTGESYIPEYVLYRARGQRPQIELALGARLSQRFSLGLGLHVGYGITAKGTAFLQTTAGSTSSMRVSASIKPQTSPNLGWLLTSEKAPWETGSWSLGQVVRMPNNAQANLSFESSARAFGSLAALDIRFGAASSMFYDPLTLETGLQWKHGGRGRLLAQLDFQNWTKFKSPALSIQNPTKDCDGCPGAPFLINPSTLPSLPLRNIWIPRIAEEIELRSTTVRLGYAYRPSMFSTLPSDSGNYLDPSKHIVSAGVGWKRNSFLGWSTPMKIDLHASYQHLLTQSVSKSPGDELGTLTSSKIGAPGYTVGGRLWGGGATMTLEL
ncbi:MAG: hypothetical protein KGQ59_12005 [Bdellovibrionales bacterium]|nr:hypothetical protein [Bdellovibrionales bacterium]